MQFTKVLFAISMSLVLVSGQFFGNYDNTYGLSNDGFGSFGGPSTFGGFGSAIPTNIQRDPRQDRGPVQFPAPPTDGPIESSGVIVGASGYGFVPPNGQQNRFIGATQNRFNNRYFQQFRFF